MSYFAATFGARKCFAMTLSRARARYFAHLCFIFNSMFIEIVITFAPSSLSNSLRRPIFHCHATDFRLSRHVWEHPRRNFYLLLHTCNSPIWPILRRCCSRMTMFSSSRTAERPKMRHFSMPLAHGPSAPLLASLRTLSAAFHSFLALMKIIFTFARRCARALWRFRHIISRLMIFGIWFRIIRFGASGRDI